ncbi:hypothetical protein NBRC10512_002659 [Rhodotorula toruloides]|uniref:RHTO0S14e01090g1_1 n=2 Tax=Rhodotorula toruloides TaxID=5286 RepID=A0A061BJQ6_RHOTO|nr:uncharacterized protein RHTO_04934 [Rhodotorula toruloides NP11]EMS24754.1 hypothetical protein RHTO_04934 [Rhodotorula toruloides NP11]CDR47250.1 RHTO0S14e01090g1_1 [Rhodotorula toruloides]
MAPPSSLLPVRKAQAGASALPRLRSVQPLSSVRPPQHLPQHDNATLARPIESATTFEDADVTDFGWGDLLDGGDEGVADGLFSEGASWLLDRTDFTIAAQTPAKDRVRCVDDPVAASENGADDEDKIILAQVARQELSSNRDQAAERSTLRTSHKPAIPSPSPASVDSANLVIALDDAHPNRPVTQPSATSSETRAERFHPPTLPARPAVTASNPSLETTAPSCARSPSLGTAASPPPHTTSGPAHPAAAQALAPHSLRSADPIAEQADDVQPADPRTLTFTLPLGPPPSRDEQSPSAPRPSDLRPLNSPPRNIAPPPAPVMSAVARPFTLTRPAHILPKNHPGHPRRSAAAAVTDPGDPSGQPKRRPEEKGIKLADDATKRKVREAKTEREKKAKERRDKAQEDAANRAAARREELARERSQKKEKRDAVARAGRRDATTARSETKQTTARDPKQHEPQPVPFLEPIAAPPTLALDADMSLPAMGAVLDFPGEVGADGGIFDASTRVTSTPARPQKRHRPAEGPAATHSASANPEVKEVKRARRTTAAMPPRETVEPIKEEKEAEEEHLHMSALQAEPRRRASRLSLAPAADNAPLPTYPSQDRTVRVFLRPPDADERRSEPPSAAEDTARPRSMSFRRASRVSFALAPGHEADGAAVSTGQTVSAAQQRRRTATRISLVPVGVPESQLSPDGMRDAQQDVHELLAARKASMSRRASRVPAIVENSAAPVEESAPLPRDGDTRPTPDGRTAAANPDPYSPPPSKADPLNRQRRFAQTLGGVTLPASFSFAAPNTDRELEAARRREEKERRDRLAEEVLAQKKRKREGVSSWAVQRGVDAKRPRLEGSLFASYDRPPPASTSPAPREPPQADGLPDERFATQSHPRSAPSLTSHANIDKESVASVGSCDSAATVPLTREALERATRKAGPRSDPMRRVSRFLEGIAEASKTDEAEVGDDSGGDALPADLDALAIGPSAPPTVEAAPLDAFALTIASAPASAPVPPAPSPSSVRAVSTQVVAPRRRASRTPLTAVVVVNNGAQGASPAFVERLSSWKARESQSLHKTAGRSTSLRATLGGARPAPDTLARRQKENAPAAAATGFGRRILAEKGVAAAMEKQIRERLEWSERQKKREEEVRQKREQMREEEAARERDKLAQLRASLAARDMRPLAKSAPRRTARS